MTLKYILLHIGFIIVSISGFSQSKIVDVNAIEFQKIIDSCNNEVIIDVQTVEEFKKWALPEAVNAPTKKELYSLTDTLDRDTPILVYCNEGERSLQAGKALLEKNFILVVNLKNGLNHWIQKGFKVKNQ